MGDVKKHGDLVRENFGSQAEAYVQSALHAAGQDLEMLEKILAEYPEANFLDVGTGGGHVSYLAARHVKQVTAYDMSAEMLKAVEKTAGERGLSNIVTRQGAAERLPFEDASFDVVASRYSAHHWHDVGQGVREISRVLKPGGVLVMMDTASPGEPVRDIFLQSVEYLRDMSHVRAYSPGEWLAFVSDAALRVNELLTLRIRYDFTSWVTRMKTPGHHVTAIREVLKTAPEEVRTYFQVEADGSFSIDEVMLIATRI
ncbi:class I SAM-dependent methyltransferase [Oxalobacter sp. OttesenSCG-928-P03]|nr:class I SAM-dependent methyltransferase [Oxalobacter sp. OttesenSCG-928-P03]